jgi:hypothetical protein
MLKSLWEGQETRMPLPPVQQPSEPETEWVTLTVDVEVID